jgi:hypothetical protein
MSKALKATLAVEPTVIHANMEGLMIGQVVNTKILEQRKQEAKQFLQKLSKKLKNIFGRRQGCKELSHSIAQKAQLRRLTKKELKQSYLQWYHQTTSKTSTQAHVVQPNIGLLCSPQLPTPEPILARTHTASPLALTVWTGLVPQAWKRLRQWTWRLQQRS